MLSSVPCLANLRFSLEGHVAVLDPTSYSLAADPFAEPTLTFSDPDHLLDANLPTTLRLSLEISDAANTSDQPICILRAVHPLNSLLPAGSSSSHPVFASGPDNGLYPSVTEAFPRELVLSPDSDADGVLDINDAFPNDPGETTDSDRDGTGDNADPDDDNDLMPDSFELAYGLNPLVNDAGGDLSAGGVSRE